MSALAAITSPLLGAPLPTTPTLIVRASTFASTSTSAGSWDGALPLSDQATSTTELDLKAPALTTAERIEDLVPYLPDTLPAINNAGMSSALLVRGFALTRFHIDGLPDIQRLYVRDLTTVARIEVQRGPDAVMHGITDPGGVVEYIGKAPSFTPMHHVSQSLGDHGLSRSTIDLTGPISNEVAYRIVASAHEGETHPGGLTDDRRVGLAALSWAYRDGGAVTVSTEEQRNRRPFLFGTVITDHGVQYDRLYASDHQHNDRRYRRTTLQWEDAVSERLTLSARYAESEVNRDETLIGFWSLRNQDSLWGYATRYRDRYTQTNWRLDARLKLGTHTLIAGRDDNRQHVDFTGTQSIGGFTISIANPDFSGVDYGSLATSNRFKRESHRDTSWFIGDHIALSEALDLSIGARQMHHAIASGAALSPAGEGDNLSWHLGLVGRPAAGFKAHAALSTGTTPNVGTTRGGRFLPAQRTRQAELGLQWQGADGITLGGAIYRAMLENLPMTDPLDKTAKISAGRRRIKGMELTGRLDHGPWAISAHGSWRATRQVVSTASWLGDAFPGVPAFSAGLSLAHTLPAVAGYPLTARLDAVHVGERHGDAANSFKVRGYRRYDIGLHTKHGRYDLDLAVRNAFDTRYIAAISAKDDVYQGERQRIIATLSSTF
ncbi:TonB-dependent receptor plug domain-containing protein [Zoogloeaceae bacterium G21618-S1]|nr:TonB-dependent receptor plug domain-containing protein [Zoogloeaceae bacterium G21618-S1]